MLGVNALSGGGGIIAPKVPVGSLLCLFNGANNSTTITDEYGNACTAQGGAKISTAQSQWGGSSLLLGGSGDWVDVVSFADATPGNSDFLVHGWARPAINNALKAIVSKRSATTANGGYAYYFDASGHPRLLVWDSAAVVTVNLTGTVVVSTATQHHTGVLKIGTKWGMLIDGAVDQTATETGTCGTAGTEPFRFGRDAGNTARDFNGNLDCWEAVKGADVADIFPNALTTLTYTVPTAEFIKG